MAALRGSFPTHPEIIFVGRCRRAKTTFFPPGQGIKWRSSGVVMGTNEALIAALGPPKPNITSGVVIRKKRLIKLLGLGCTVGSSSSFGFSFSFPRGFYVGKGYR